MMSNRAVRGLLLMIVGCCLANLALVVRLDFATADRYYRHNAELDLAVVHEKLDVLERNQKILVARQRYAMEQLKLDPSTQP